jgi:hypothetical protein
MYKYSADMEGDVEMDYAAINEEIDLPYILDLLIPSNRAAPQDLGKEQRWRLIIEVLLLV